jgi:hypothetical protein
MSLADDENALTRTDARIARPGLDTIARPEADNGHGLTPDNERRGKILTSRPTGRIWMGGYLAAGFLLFLCYLRISGTAAVTSDGGLSAMQAWDMLHGNWLLRGWALGDVTYYTTELPEYALVEIFRGLGSADVHISGAITYTLLVVLAGLLAKGAKTGKEGLIRVLIASVIMIAPQSGPGVGILLQEPDHIGTGVPLLLTFLLLDRAPRRWWVPAAVGLMLVWAQIGDPTVETMAVLPIVVVCGTLAYRDNVQRREPLRTHWFNLAMVASAVVSAGLATSAVKIISRLGGYSVAPLTAKLAPSASWPANVTMVVDGVLRLFGAGFNAAPLGFATLLSVVHLVGVALATWALCRVIRRFFTFDDLIAQILAVGIMVQLIAYGISTLPYASYQNHEIAAVLPFGAALAGRVLADRLSLARLLPALTVVACGYLVALGYGAQLPQATSHNEVLASWLRAHHLTAGFTSYSDAAAIELFSGGTVSVTVPWFHPDYVARGALFEENVSAFDPRRHYANFVVTTRQDGPVGYINPSWAIRAFGKPAHIYHYQAWTIITWNKNLLDEVW